MEIMEIPIDEIKPDANQPRQSFDKKVINEMAQSILTEGIINPIEIDEDNVIVTGELRWRAAKVAGLETVPCKIITIPNGNRFMRQMIENLHQNSMTSYDTARCLEKLLSEYSPKKKAGSGGQNDKGLSWLAKKVGKSVAYISDHLDILKSSEELQEAIKTMGVKHTMIRAVKNTPEEHQGKMEKKIISGEFKSTNRAMEVAGALKNNPSIAEEIIGQDYSECETPRDIENKIKEVVPDFTSTPGADMVDAGFDFPEALADLSLELIKLLKANPFYSVGLFHGDRVLEDLARIRLAVDEWLTLNQEDDQLELPVTPGYVEIINKQIN